MANKPKVESPKVIAMAEGRVDLTTVAGSGRNGVITPNDVLRAYIADTTGLPRDTPSAQLVAGMTAVLNNVRKRQEAAADAMAEQQERARLTAASAPSAAYAGRVAARGPAYHLNPLVAQASAALASAKIAPSRPSPTLFAAGDLPSFTASGIPVDQLLDVPWTARHALAAAPTQAEAYEIVEKCTNGDGFYTGEQCAQDYGDHPGNAIYARRVKDWAEAEAAANIDEDAALSHLLNRPESTVAP